ncbi:hypothetical protein U9M48_023551 [Paspalum notatum var. saurae]|uniref:SWIM-type domain-containing protein n=1 Tax=Paspalum notatum var. saurae TaxID=547442 RepID=A0AAQ3WVV8_PASNO
MADKVSIFASNRGGIDKGHFTDHVKEFKFSRMHWLKPGHKLSDGLLLLTNDASCQLMATHMANGGTADIYVEDAVQVPELQSRKEKNKDWRSFMQFYRSPSKVPQASCVIEEGGNADEESSGHFGSADGGPMGMITVSMKRTMWVLTVMTPLYQPLEDDSSAEDEESQQLKKFAKEIKIDIKAKKLGVHGSQLGQIGLEDVVREVPNLEDPGSPCYDSSDAYSYEEDSDGDTRRWKSLENRYESKAPIPIFSLGMAFRSSRQFKKAVVKYGVKNHKHILFVKDEKNRVRATCSWKGCKWMIYGSLTTRSDWFKVVTFVDEHTCPPRRDNKLITSNLIAKHYFNEIKDNPTWKVGLIKKVVLKDMLADASIAKCKRAKSLVLKAALDSMKGEYTRVYDYQAELLRSNPGSTVVVCLDPEIEDRQVFERFYVCFDALKRGFIAGCRRVVGLDGCWFKGANNGQLLCAIGKDANNQMYPIAWAAVPNETYDTWYWFIGLLQKDLNISNGVQDWVFISDQQKGLLKAVGELVPNAEHRMCARHIYANWRKKHTDKELQKKWWACAKSPNRSLFNYNRARLAQETPEEAQDMMKTSPEHWSRAYFRLGSNCDSVDNNLCESFNNCIMDARFFPVISMSEAIKNKLMVRIQENRARAQNWAGTICPNIFKKLKVNIIRSRNCDVLWNGVDGFEVQEKETHRFIVNLNERTCTCRYWQLLGLPCYHAISCIYKALKVLDEFIAPCFIVSCYNNIYAHALQPVEGPTNWPSVDMPRPEPLGFVKMPGRPKTERRREPGEAPKGTKLSRVGTRMSCRLCGKSDHNARRCPRNLEAGKKKMHTSKGMQRKIRKLSSLQHQELGNLKLGAGRGNTLMNLLLLQHQLELLLQFKFILQLKLLLALQVQLLLKHFMFKSDSGLQLLSLLLHPLDSIA